MQNKAQAALEFLMTYGWAILAAVIAIAVLAYFGVFSPSRYVPETCVLSAPLGCDDDQTLVNAGDAGVANVKLFITNGGGDTYTITSIGIENCNENVTSIGTDITSGATESYTITCDEAIGAGDKFRGPITVSYKKGATGRTLTSTGSLTRKAI